MRSTRCSCRDKMHARAPNIAFLYHRRHNHCFQRSGKTITRTLKIYVRIRRHHNVPLPNPDFSMQKEKKKNSIAAKHPTRQNTAQQYRRAPRLVPLKAIALPLSVVAIALALALSCAASVKEPLRLGRRI